MKNKDLEIVKDLARRYLLLNTISWLILEDFCEKMVTRTGEKKLSTARVRLRNALNQANVLGLCEKYYVGTSYYQTSDTLGGKVYVCYDFVKWVTTTGRLEQNQKDQ